MPRLPRPHIPLDVRCRVVLRQLGEMWPDEYMAARREAGQSFANILQNLLAKLAALLNAEKLHLDHDPALENRKKVIRKGEHVGYKPDANDPEFLRYREQHAHYIKTHVRGDGAQYSDTTLAKRERRRQKKAASKPATLAKKMSRDKRAKRATWAKAAVKHRWPTGRKIPSRPFSNRKG